MTVVIVQGHQQLKHCTHINELSLSPSTTNVSSLLTSNRSAKNSAMSLGMPESTTRRMTWPLHVIGGKGRRGLYTISIVPKVSTRDGGDTHMSSSSSSNSGRHAFTAAAMRMAVSAFTHRLRLLSAVSKVRTRSTASSSISTSESRMMRNMP